MKALDSLPEITIVNSDNREPIAYGDVLNLYENREKSVASTSEFDDPLVSVFFQAYNHLEDYTKPALEALFKYTTDIDYELILVDNGSSDGTFEYFKSLKHPRKRIYRITKNIGAFYGYIAAKNATLGRFLRGQYFVGLPNDVLVTTNWLKNMLICMESDERIGFLVPMSVNITNRQHIDLGYVDLVDMQQKAAAFNISDPKKWYDRLRLIPTVCMIRTSLREFYEADYAFVYNFSDDDISFAYRRLGYRLILCGDVFVHHKGSTVVGVDRKKYVEDLRKGAELFRRKYNGIDAWDDILNFEPPMVNALLENADDQTSSIRTLGIDVRCGTPLFEIKNALRSKGILDVHLTSYTTEAKYWQDLSFVCDGNVYCGDIDRISQKLAGEKYDYIIIGEYLDTYDSPIDLLQDADALLAEGGALVFKTRNYDVPCDDLQMISNALGTGADRLLQGIDMLMPYLERLPYRFEVYSYIDEDALSIKPLFFGNLRSMKEYQENKRVKELYTEERFDLLMTRYAIVMRKNS